MWFQGSGLCGITSDAVDAVRSSIPKGFKFWGYKLIISFLWDLSSPKYENVQFSTSFVTTTFIPAAIFSFCERSSAAVWYFSIQ